MKSRIVIILYVSLICTGAALAESSGKAGIMANWTNKRTNEILVGTETNGSERISTYDVHKNVFSLYGLLQYQLTYTSAASTANAQVKVMPRYNVENLTGSYYNRQDNVVYEVDMVPIMNLLVTGDLVEILGISRNYILVHVYEKEYFTTDSNHDGMMESYTRFIKNDFYVFRISDSETRQLTKAPLSMLTFAEEDDNITQYIDSVKVAAMAGNKIALKFSSTAISNTVNNMDKTGTGTVVFNWRQSCKLIVYNYKLAEAVEIGDLLTGKRQQVWSYKNKILDNYKDFGDDVSLEPYYTSMPQVWKASIWNYDYESSYDSSGKPVIEKDTGITNLKLYNDFY